jgi:hypothetical protein
MKTERGGQIRLAALVATVTAVAVERGLDESLVRS